MLLLISCLDLDRKAKKICTVTYNKDYIKVKVSEHLT